MKLENGEEIAEEVQGLCEILSELEYIFERVEDMGAKFKSEKQAAEFMKLYQDLNNNTRLNVNRGFTPSEIFTQFNKPAAKKVKIGRNEFCPCGSGKKYKKCCGKDVVYH